MDSRRDTPKGWVAPFGDLGITGRSPLPRAFRSVPRPSSPLGAKASTRCPSTLEPRIPGCPEDPVPPQRQARLGSHTRHGGTHSLNDIDPTTRPRRSKAADRVITIKTRHRPCPAPKCRGNGNAVSSSSPCPTTGDADRRRRRNPRLLIRSAGTHRARPALPAPARFSSRGRWWRRTGSNR